MKPDTKQKVLLAIYTEYQKDLPKMDNINAEALGMSEEIFGTAIKKLQDEELIGDVHLIWGEESLTPMGVVLTVGHLTRHGIEYVEKYFGIENGLPAKQKVQILHLKFSEWGLKELNAISTRVLAEMKDE